MKTIDKKKLIDHLKICINISAKKNETKVAAVLQNLKNDIKEGIFDVDET
jgi:hypothetical protein